MGYDRHGDAGLSAARQYSALRRRRRAGAFLLLGAVVVAGTVLMVGDRVALVGALVLGFAGAVLVMRAGTDPGRWWRGAEGEQATARILSGLPGRRFVVLHDLRVPGSRANIDHLVIGRTGVWVIDTKATRAGVRKGWFSVRLGDRKLDTAPVRWEADVVADRLGVDVRPLVVVHGKGMHGSGRSGGVRVVGPDQLLRRIRRGRRRLDRPTVTALENDAVATFAPYRSGRPAPQK